MTASLITMEKMEINKIYNENCLDTMSRMPDEFVDCVVTSPPYYGLRDYGHVEQIGLEPTFQEYLDRLIEVFAEVKRVLKKDGTVWVNLGDSYYNLRPSKTKCNPQTISNGNNRNYQDHRDIRQSVGQKSLLNIPNRFAIRMTDELGFIQRNEIIWHKPACMPASAKDRFTVDFEKIFFFTKSEKYYFEQQLETHSSKNGFRYAKEYNTAVSNGNGQPNNVNHKGIHSRPGNSEGRNMRAVWKVPFEPQSDAHYASYPTRLIETPIKAGCPVGGIVYEPFTGTGTTLVVAHKLGRNWIGSEISAEYIELANKRLEPYLMQETLF